MKSSSSSVQWVSKNGSGRGKRRICWLGKIKGCHVRVYGANGVFVASVSSNSTPIASCYDITASKALARVLESLDAQLLGRVRYLRAEADRLEAALQ